MCLPQGSRDAPMKQPTRKTSFSSSEQLLKSQHQLLLSSSQKFSSPVLSSPRTSLDCCTREFLPTSSSSLYLSADELVGFSDFTLDCLEETAAEDEERGVVRFAALPTTETITVMGLDDYSPEEVEACWYSHDDMGRFRLQENLSNRNKTVLCPPPNRGSTRWST